MLKKTYFKATGMFLCVGLYLFGFSYTLSGKDKPFEMKLIKEFKTAEEYEMYKKAHPEVFGVKKGEEKRIRVEGDRIRFYDEKGNLIRERRVYQGKEVFEAKDKYGKIEKFRLYSDFYISPKGDLVVEQRWKGPPPPSEEPAWIEKAIIYNGRGEITGEIHSLGIDPFILPESRCIIGISGGEGWADRKVHVYDIKGNVVKTIEFDIRSPEDGFAKISSDGGYAMIVFSNMYNYKTEVILIDKEVNIIWRKKLEGWSRRGVATLSTFGEYVALRVSKRDNNQVIIVLDKGGNKILEQQKVNYVDDLCFIDNTRIFAFRFYTIRNNPVFMVLIDPISDKILYKEPLKGFEKGADMKIKLWDSILAVGSGSGEEDKEFGSRGYIRLFHWKASDEMFLKGGGR